MKESRITSSYKDPSGFLFRRDGKLYRQVNRIYSEHYDHLISSGLYKRLVEEGLLIPHREVSPNIAPEKGAYKVIQPEEVPFISYPYEWCFSQLKDAALATLKIQEIALSYGMTLKDASGFNVQFFKGKPVLIDTLSFEIYVEGRAWVAYRQFCEFFLAPLALASYVDPRLILLLRIYLEGIPLDLASRLLPFRSFLSPSLLSHLHFHAKAQRRFAGREISYEEHKISRKALFALVDNLKSTVEGMKLRKISTVWADYYEKGTYTQAALKSKKRLIREILDRVEGKKIWDLGANIGIFSEIAADKAEFVLSLDFDPAAVEVNYLKIKEKNLKNVLPLVMDLSNPTPSLGWAGEERYSLLDRGPADVLLVLALIHHLVFSHNLTFSKIASFLASAGKVAVIEFVPPHDPQSRKLMRGREEVFNWYNQESFEKEFSRFFKIIERYKIEGSDRILYLMERKI